MYPKEVSMLVNLKTKPSVKPVGNQEDVETAMPAYSRFVACDVESNALLHELFKQHPVAELDSAQGLECFKGDAIAYLCALRSFLRNVLPLLRCMQEPTRPELLQYTILAHGVRDSSKRICAYAVSVRAEELEVAAKSGDIAFVQEYNSDLLRHAQQLISGLRIFLEAADATLLKVNRVKPELEILVEFREASTG
jgi:hypothetical protein